ncbi:VOC family protein [Halomarina oriensis]|uniref:VOC family protein n=1 Tax=Halomarina oriensis TaxID=671145 RepID=A0A6B0GMA5_9EURY|nr:VOC family protein [Halomarina oriensis]
MTDDIDISAERPASTIAVEGTDHVTLVGSNPEDTVAFYRDVLGMRLVMRQPNLDRSEVEHLFFDAGDGRLVTFFCEADRESAEDQAPGVGAVHHLAFRLDPAQFRETRENLQESGRRFSEFDRGAFHSLYTKDHNGLVVELVADKFVVPDDRRAEVLATAHAHRVEAGAEFVRGEDLAAALESLGLPVEEHDLPDAPTGTDVPVERA